VAMNQLGPVGAKKAPRSRQPLQHACRRPLHVKMNDAEPRGPLFLKPRPEHHQRDRVSPLGHARGERQNLPFRSAHAERSEHIHDAKMARFQHGVLWNR